MKKWIMKQTWKNLLFVHWPVEAEWLEERLPAPLKADLFKGEAWIGLVPFEMHDIRFKGLPSVPMFSSLIELNVRTYVTYKGKPGVYFFSLDASQPAGVWMARTFFHLPYFRAKMSADPVHSGTHLVSKRTHKGEPSVQLDMTYKPGEHVIKPSPLEQWLTERYCLYTVGKNQLFRGDLTHSPWSFSRGTCDIMLDSLTQPYNRKDWTDLHILHSMEVKTEFYPFVKLL